VRVFDPPVPHPFCKSLRLVDRFQRFRPSRHHQHPLSDDTIVDSSFRLHPVVMRFVVAQGIT
jgi:hypothetical protein